MNEQLGKAAHTYTTLAKEIKLAEQDVDKAKSRLENLRSRQIEAGKTLAESVGNNIQRRAFVSPDNGCILTIDHQAGIHVYENGEEIR